MERLPEARALPRDLADGSVVSSPALAAEEPVSKPWFAGRPQPPDSGWERVRELFRRNEFNHYPEETMNILKASFSGGVIGLIYGGIPGFVYAKKRYIQQSEGEIYYNRLDAVQSAHRAAIRGFIRYGWRWGWRVAAFAGIFNTVSTGLSAYRDKNALSHFVVAGACTGGLFRIHLGLVGLAGGSIFGALLGVPAGGLLMAVQKFAGETVIEKKNRERRDLYEQKMTEWSTSLNITESISKEIDDTLQEGVAEKIQK